jgi:hypothetical protein
MTLDPVVLSSITTAVALLGQDYLKGVSGEAGKATWNGIKHLFGWQADPSIAEIPANVAEGLSNSPEILEKLLELLKQDRVGPAASLVQNVTVAGGKAVFAQTIHTLNM